MFINEPQEFYGNGWIKIYRKIQSKGYYKKSEYIHLWIHLLLKANHKEVEFMWNGEVIIIKGGQLLTGRKALSDETGIPESTIERILKLLENEQQIEQEKTTKFRIITIINWKEYQGEQQTDNRWTTNGQQTDTNKNEKNDKNENKKEGVLYPINKIKTEYFLDILPIDSTQQFIDAWTEWVDFRKEIKKKLTKLSAKKQITFLINQPEPIKCINQSIQNGWTGLFEVSQKQAGKIIQSEYTYLELNEMSKNMSKEERVKFWDKYEIQENKKWKLK